MRRGDRRCGDHAQGKEVPSERERAQERHTDVPDAHRVENPVRRRWREDEGDAGPEVAAGRRPHTKEERADNQREEDGKRDPSG